MYKVFLTGTSATDLYELVPKSYEFTDELNDQSTARVTMGLGELIKLATAHNTTWRAMLTTGARELYILRNDGKIYRGVISGLDFSPSTEGNTDVQIKSMSWLGVLGKRITGIPKENHASGDIGDLAWTWIDDSQNSDSPYSELGITQGASPAISNHEKTNSFDNVKDMIIAYSKKKIADGYDFDIDMAKAFNVYTSKGSDKTGVVFDDRLLLDWRLKTTMISDMTNKVYVVGEGVNDDLAYVTRTASTALRDAWYTLESVVNARDVSETSTLNNKGDQALEDGKEPTDVLDIKVDESLYTWADYDIGDTIYVTIKDLALSQVGKRVVKRTFSITQEKGAPIISVSLQ